MPSETGVLRAAGLAPGDAKAGEADGEAIIGDVAGLAAGDAMIGEAAGDEVAAVPEPVLPALLAALELELEVELPQPAKINAARAKRPAKVRMRIRIRITDRISLPESQIVKCGDGFAHLRDEQSR